MLEIYVEEISVLRKQESNATVKTLIEEWVENS